MLTRRIKYGIMLVRMLGFLRKSLMFVDVYVMPIIIVICGIVCIIKLPWYLYILTTVWICRMQVTVSPCPIKVFCTKLLDIEIRIRTHIRGY